METDTYHTQCSDAMYMYERDRFELLSAYLDGEVTAAEGRQIENWLTTDPGAQRLYARAMKLRQEWQTIPMSPAQQPVEYTLGQVCPRLHARSKMAVVWGSAVLLAMLLGTLLAILPEHQFPVPIMTQAPQLGTK